jgi:hypothetical protein
MNILNHLEQIEVLVNTTSIANRNNLSSSVEESQLLHKSLYWTHNNPWDTENDSDFDGISDSTDYHVGPGQFGD